MAHDYEVEITKDGRTSRVMKSSVPVWERHGWTRTDDGSSTESSPEPAPEDELQPEPPATTKEG